MFCSYCGASLYKGDLFCIKCGRQQPTYENKEPEESGEQPLQDIRPEPDPEGNAAVSDDNAPADGIPAEGGLFSQVQRQKPLYGYEPYDHEAYLQSLKAAPDPVGETPEISRQRAPYPPPYRPPAYQPPPLYAYPPVYPHGYIAPNPIYSRSIERPRSNNSSRVRTLPIVLAIVLSSIFLMIGAIAAAGIIAGSIRDSVSALFGDYGYDTDGSYDWDNPYPDNMYPPGDGFQQSGGDYAEYDKLIGRYLEMASRGDPAGIVDFLHPNIIDALEAKGLKPEEFADELDEYIENYGVVSDSFSIFGIYPYNNSGYGFLSEQFGFDQAQIQQYVNVYADVSLVFDDELGRFYYNFDFIKVSDVWYIVRVW